MPRRILVPLDGSHRAEAALAQLPEHCGHSDEITLLSVVKPAPPEKIGTSMGQSVSHYYNPRSSASARDIPVFETEEEARERQLTNLGSYLSAQADILRKQGFDVRIQPLMDSRPARAIIEYARSYRPSAIIMVRRTHDPRRLIFGSVSSEVARADVAPILLLPSREARP
jgi:nucleotide-binding universal stress UspA family protein